MHTFYLRNFYVENLLAKGELEIAGRTIDLSVVKSSDVHRQREERPHRAVGSAVQDHRTVVRRHSVRAEQRRPHRGHRQPAGAQGMVPLQRRQSRPLPTSGCRAASRTAESWWIDWAAWASEHAGPMVQPPKIGSRKHKVLGDGPGEYVFD